MNCLLDTCVMSEFTRKRGDRGVLAWFYAQEEESLHISALTIGEIQKGIAKLPRSKRKTEFERWLESIIARYDGRILPFTISTARLWGQKLADMEKRGRPIPLIDSLIAATALEHDLTLVTRNHPDFTGTGVKIFDPWD